MITRCYIVPVTDAILAQKAQAASYQRVAPQLGVQNNDEDNENDDPSPKSHKVKRKAGYVLIYNLYSLMGTVTAVSYKSGRLWV